MTTTECAQARVPVLLRLLAMPGPPPPHFFVSVASKRDSVFVSGLESTVADILASAASILKDLQALDCTKIVQVRGLGA